jgi:hypothetical protein
VFVIAAGVAVAVSMMAGGAGAASQLSFSEARLVGQKHVRQEHCPVVCHSSRVRSAKRINPQKIEMKGRTRYPVGDGTTKRVCSGRVIVKKRGGRVKTDSRGWSCRNA